MSHVNSETFNLSELPKELSFISFCHLVQSETKDISKIELIINANINFPLEVISQTLQLPAYCTIIKNYYQSTYKTNIP